MSQNKLAIEQIGQGIAFSRDFDAPRELVFKTLTDAKLIPQWWGPKKYKTVVEQMEVKMGGVWRYIHHTDNGSQIGFHGVYHEVLPLERLVYTFEFEGFAGHAALETIRLEEHAGKTRLSGITVFQSIEDCNGAFQSEMEQGANETYERFAELLAKAAVSA